MTFKFTVPANATFEQICHIRNVAFGKITQQKNPPNEIVVVVGSENDKSEVMKILQFEKICPNVVYSDSAGLAKRGQRNRKRN